MNTKVRDLTTGALFIAIICVFAQLKINITGFVPITLQTLAIYLIGALLKPQPAFFCVSGYLVIGAIGLPVFSNFGSGLGSLLGMTGGYLVVFPLMAASISYLIHKRVNIVLAYVMGTILCYSFGTIWFMYYTSQTLQASLALCVYPFLLGDAIKIGIASYLYHKIKKVH